MKLYSLILKLMLHVELNAKHKQKKKGSTPLLGKTGWNYGELI